MVTPTAHDDGDLHRALKSWTEGYAEGEDEGGLIGSLLELLPAMVHSAAGRPLRERHGSEDLLQEVIAAVLRAACDARLPHPAALRAWLRRIVRSTIVDLARRERALKRDSSSTVSLEQLEESRVCGKDRRLSPGSPSGADDPGGLERHELLRKLLDGLPPAQRTALELRELEGRSTAEIASVMGRSESAIRKLITRARARCLELAGGR